MLRIIKESKKVTESFRQDFYDWYDGLNGYWQAKVDEFIEDEGYPDMITDLSESDMEIIMDEFNPEYFDTDEEDLDEGCKTEDTIKKSNGKWTNKGKNGEHGEFKTKKAADAQRKAMFANGYKAEALGSPEHPAWLDDEGEYSDFDDNEVHIGNTFIEEGEEYEWVDQASDVYYLDFDAWQVWKATSVDSGEDAYFVVDKDTGFIDWGPCGEEEAIEFLRSKVDDYNLDESYSPSNSSIDTLLEINEFDGYRVETYLNELGYNSENTQDLSQIPDDVAKKVVLRIKNDYQNNIDKYGDDAQVPFEAFELLNL